MSFFSGVGERLQKHQPVILHRFISDNEGAEERTSPLQAEQEADLFYQKCLNQVLPMTKDKRVTPKWTFSETSVCLCDQKSVFSCTVWPRLRSGKMEASMRKNLGWERRMNTFQSWKAPMRGSGQAPSSWGADSMCDWGHTGGIDGARTGASDSPQTWKSSGERMWPLETSIMYVKRTLWSRVLGPAKRHRREWKESQMSHKLCQRVVSEARIQTS